MRCPNCKLENQETNSYCGSCGVALKPENDRLRRDIENAVKAEVARSLRDRDVVEVEASEAVMTRVISWAKAFGYAAGIPLTILALVLAAIGITTTHDIQNKRQEVADAAEKAKEDIKANAETDVTERRARNLIDLSYYYSAAKLLRQLYEKNGNDELLFSRLVEAYVAGNEVDSAVDLIKHKFPATHEQVGTYVQAGHILMRSAIEKEEKEKPQETINADTRLSSLKDAEHMLEDGEAVAGAVNDQLNYKNLMGELALCYALEYGDSNPKARRCGGQWATLSNELGPPVKWEPPLNEKWTERLDPTFIEVLRTEVFTDVHNGTEQQ